MAFSSVFAFPRLVDERAARLVACGVAAGALTALLVWPPLAGLLAAGFALRVGWGPRFSPLARVVTGTVVPRLDGPERLVPGPPKRFAQTVGLGFSLAALVATVAGRSALADVLLGCLLAAALLEATVGLCLGCVAFGLLMRIGAIPKAVCIECADISRRLPAPRA